MKALFFANTDWYLYNFRLPLAEALRQRGVDVVLVSPPGEHVHTLESKGFRWLPFPLRRRGMNPLKELSTIVRLIHLYKREAPDLLHHFTVKCVLYGSMAGRLVGISSIVNAVTGLGYIFTAGGVMKSALRVIIKAWYRWVLRGTRIVFQNEDDLEDFVRQGLLGRESIHLIRGSGVDTSLFVPVPEPEDVPVVVLAARMLWDKGVGEFVEAARILQKQGVQARFVLVGDTYADNPAAIPTSQLVSWKEEGVVEWWGWREDMPVVYAGANLVCLPSYREGMPKSLIEAAACGRAIVTTDAPGCRQAVRHGENGLLVKVRDAPALADALSTMIKSPGLRRRMGKKGRKIAVDEYSVGRVINETLAVYRKAGLKGI